MKKLFQTILLCIPVILGIAQSPKSFNYQAVIRDATGLVIPDQNVGIRISILQGSVSGPSVYTETHSPVTNSFGLVNLQIGGGTVESGNFTGIPWGSDAFFVQIELDETGGTSYQPMGVSQMLSVPYAFFADKAGNINNNDTSATNEIQVLSISNDTLYLSGGGFAVLPAGFSGDYNDLVNTPVNVSDFTNDAGYITSPDDADANPVNEIQSLTMSNDTLYLTGVPPVYLENLSDTSFWKKTGNDLYYQLGNVSVGSNTVSPAGRLQVLSDPLAATNDVIFSVLNADGDTVFAVYQEGVRIWVNDDGAKAAGSRGGFAVGGISPAKGYSNEYLRVTPDSVRVYIEESSGTKLTGSRGGFAVGGLSPSKTMTDYYFNIEYDTTEIINPSQARMLWYPNREAFLAGRVLVENADSVGTNSVAIGYESKSIGDYSEAFGYKARAFGLNSIAVGYYANSTGENAYALGNMALASDTGSYAFGTVAQASGLRSFALGSSGIDMYGFPVGSTKAVGDYSYAFGMGSASLATGSFTFGTQDTASGQFSTAMGYQSKASGQTSTAIGNRAKASGDGAFAVGDLTTASGQSSFTSGTNTLAQGYASTAMGNSCSALNSYDFAIGSNTIANGGGATAMGQLTLASGGMSTAIGYSTTAGGFASFSAGTSTIASGYASFALGDNITASGARSFAISLDNPWPLVWDVTQDNTMAIMGGRVGIGTLSPDKLFHVAGDARVEGNIYYGPTGSVTIYTKPDYVFDPGYDNDFDLDILAIEKYIKKNNHLPWVTAAKDEENGINMTRMSFESLEAIENLQMQIIELKKENMRLVDENASL
ncbi:MAG: hypothetical protein ABIJ16_04185, partial [Bacteroidota bacterium]